MCFDGITGGFGAQIPGVRARVGSGEVWGRTAFLVAIPSLFLHSWHGMFRRCFNLIMGVACATVFLLMTVNSFLAKDWDFPVFYRAAANLLNLEPVYALMRDQGSSFKYPPWIAPFFVPLLPFGESAANAVWRVFLVVCAGYSALWCARAARDRMSSVITVVLFYGIFHFNVLSGQIQLPLLALSLLAWNRLDRDPGLSVLALTLAFSAKVFNVFSFLGIPRRVFSWRRFAFTAGVCFALSLPVLAGFGWNPFEALRAFLETASSRTVNLSGGRDGFASFFVFIAGAGSPRAEWLAFAGSLFCVGAYLLWLKRRIGDPRRFYAVALAFGAAIHPLAFSYSYVWAFPLNVMAVDRFRTRARGGVADAALLACGIFLLHVYGSGFTANLGFDLPVFGARAIGCFLFAWLLKDREAGSPDLPAPLPGHLSGNEAKGMVPGEVIAQYELGPGRNFSYLILDWESRIAAIVDPQKDLSGVLADLEREGFTLGQILITHTHPDHTAGLPDLLARFPGIPFHVGKEELHRLAPAVRASDGLRTIDSLHKTGGGRGGLGGIRVGNLLLSTHATPGHSAGEVCFYLEKGAHSPVPYLFTGDTIFIRDCGRTDFADGSDEEMFRSIQRVKGFRPETVLLVGHHYAPEVATTLERELSTSPPFLCKSVQELKELP